MVRIVRTGRFNQSLDELLFEYPDLLTAVNNKIKWFQINPVDTRLDNHPLTKRMSGKWAFSITDDIRITYEWLSKTTVRFRDIGPHDKVYKKQSTKR